MHDRKEIISFYRRTLFKRDRKRETKIGNCQRICEAECDERFGCNLRRRLEVRIFDIGRVKATPWVRYRLQGGACVQEPGRRRGLRSYRLADAAAQTP